MADTGVPPWLQGIEGEYLPPLILSDEKAIRVVAGPGSGKTEGLRRRTWRLMEHDNVSPERILVGTFTRAIAEDLRDSLNDAIKVTTLHALACELLRHHPTALKALKLRFLLGYEEDAMLYDIAPMVGHLKDQAARKVALAKLEGALSDMKELPDLQFEGAVDRWMRTHGGILVGLVVHLAIKGLESGDIPTGLFDEVIVDEYQDLTAAEQRLVEKVWSGKRSLVVLGDNDQSIYSFRDNHPRGIDEFRDRWAEAGLQDLEIPENRRCGEEVVDLANRMMAESGSTKPPMLAKSQRSGLLHQVYWENLADEIAGLAEHINRYPEQEFLVLVPKKIFGFKLKDRIGPSASTSFHQEVLGHQQVQERFSAASVLADPTDKIAVRTWLGFHATQPKHADKRNAPAYLSIDPFPGTAHELIAALASDEISLTGSGREHVGARARQMKTWIDEASSKSLQETIELLFDPALAQADDDEKRRWVAEDLVTLRTAGLEFAKADDADLKSVMSKLRYRIATRATLVEPEVESRVRIMTLHSAKGLQADHIVIAGLADEVVPGLTIEMAKREEQRRLIYVAITRARSSLVVSWPTRIPWEVARRNQIRLNRDTVETRNGEVVFRCGRTSLLPAGLGVAKPGSAWLKESKA